MINRAVRQDPDNGAYIDSLGWVFYRLGRLTDAFRQLTGGGMQVVAVMGDAGIHAKMGDEEWRRAVDALVAGIRRGNPAEGFADAIRVVGDRLAEHFPRREGEPSENELPDELLRDR